MVFWAYIDISNEAASQGNVFQWIATSLQVAHAVERGPWLARRLCEWCRAFIADRKALPCNIYGTWNVSLLEDEDLAQDICLHLQGIRKYVKAMDIVHYLNTPEMKEHLKFKKVISLATAQCWMRKMDYCWSKDPEGQFVDGHEQEDVVAYLQQKILPAWAAVESQMCAWDNGVKVKHPTVEGCRTVICWVHKSETAVPYAKGEGVSLMVADFVSADYGWLQSPDGSEETRVLFKAGKVHDRYFTNADILHQASCAIDILEKHYLSEDHILLFDNVTTHLKHADDALSACKMPKNTPKGGKTGVAETKVPMRNTTFADGTLQCLYFPTDHPDAPGVFKGMAIILEERGYANASKIRAECKGFKHAKDASNCCCWQMLYNEHNFAAVESLLEITCKAHGFQVLFLPKFHCELNFIEQCWGYSKRIYRQFPISPKEEDLKRNVLTALKSGLNGKQAAWATKKYRGHRVLPETIMNELEGVILLRLHIFAQHMTSCDP
ncbi:hypothetical protein K439DRAFT_1647663 [Ramaria rubella]|nr:hypothetical protein K439DRAFT_1647663 [Ramaria rubella]